MKEATLGMTLNTKYQGGEFDERWDWQDVGISGFYGSFELSP